MKKFILFLIISLCVFVFVKLQNSYPVILTDLQFDAQNIIVWKYASQLKLYPYKDVFFPYGVFTYFVNAYPYITFAYCIIILVLLVKLFLVFYKILDKTYYACLCFAIILYNILFVTGIVSFSRYGITIVGSLTFASILYTKNSSKLVFVFGIISGILITNITDQGISLFIVSTILFALHTFLNLKKKANEIFLLSQFKKYFLYILGCLIGALPMLYFFYNAGILAHFVSQFLSVSDISLFAKTPYFHSLREINEAGNFLTLFTSVTYITYVLLFKRKSVSVRFYAIFALTVSLFLFEQKSIIRFVGHQIDFVSLLLVSILIYDAFYKYIKKINRLFSISTIAILCFIFIFLLRNPIPGFVNSKPLTENKPVGINKYQKVIDKLPSVKNYDGKILSLPGDPIFYVVNKQSPPYYFTNYEASPRYAQQKIINYVKKNKINFVIFNTAIQSIQDGVPDYARTPYLYSYIFGNFSPVLLVDNFVVLEKGKNLFENNDKSMAGVLNYFLTSDFGNIPRSEGKYKVKYITSKPEFVIKDSSKSVKISSSNKVFLVYYKTGSSKDSIVKIGSGKYVAIVKFSSCDINFPCLINISNIPLFYSPKTIEKINFDKNSIEKIEVYTQKQRDMLW